MSRKRAAWLTLAPLVALTVGLGTAVAHKKGFPTKNVTIAYSEDPRARESIWDGEVKAKRRACRRGRQIVVKDENGNTIATGSSNANGNWEARTRGRATPGLEYFARAKRKRVRKNAKHNHFCRPKKSARLVARDVSPPGGEPRLGPR